MAVVVSILYGFQARSIVVIGVVVIVVVTVVVVSGIVLRKEPILINRSVGRTLMCCMLLKYTSQTVIESLYKSKFVIMYLCYLV